MLKILRFCAIIIASLIVSGVLCVCHAVIKVPITLYVEHNKPPITVDTAIVEAPKIKYSLITKGITIDDCIDEVKAVCTLTRGEVNYTRMFLRAKKQAIVDFPALYCQVGQGIEIVISGLGSSNKCQYIAMLVMDIYEDEDEEEKQQKVNATMSESDGLNIEYSVPGDFLS